MIMHATLEDAKKQKEEYESLVGQMIKGEKTPLLKLIIIQKTPTEFGEMFAAQREVFDDEDNTKIISNEDFEQQMKDFDNLDLTKVDGQFYFVVGVFRYSNGESRFQPLDCLLTAIAS
jgi:hypothetical protein